MANQMPLSYVTNAISDRIERDLHQAIERQLLEAVMPRIKQTTADIVEQIKEHASVQVHRNFSVNSVEFTIVFNGSVFEPDASKE
ncbi:hypothetical protein [Pandoraea apista]|uniref:Uncharacterized protein n=1 Tax=Pandoraea apista TaxID=93218 RepID=A0ABX9ZHH9_9BURK|nr:hypothetical protein [Pandoraea apista]PTE02695.1 hypothetical protein C7830_00270 [Pandoraea apista]RRJ27564.1 hypothetical protein EIB05_21645 [Pandoraea apista]RRJ73145.1 hypothetical protein EIL82_21920 [Pandoraea apista]RSD06456.1 hypothetical protein EJB12_21510 [Pandoraea apista]RSD11301.1 hypothetical protein EIZ52_21635 [Pandoraea apista]